MENSYGTVRCKEDWRMENSYGTVRCTEGGRRDIESAKKPAWSTLQSEWRNVKCMLNSWDAVSIYQTYLQWSDTSSFPFVRDSFVPWRATKWTCLVYRQEATCNSPFAPLANAEIVTLRRLTYIHVQRRFPCLCNKIFGPGFCTASIIYVWLWQF